MIQLVSKEEIKNGKKIPIVSVIIPTYNEENFIEPTLYSLINQSLKRDLYEIIIVDGNSKDKTCFIASKYADKVLHQKSKGVGLARNEGAAVSKGQILVHTDSDVIVPFNWLEQICSLMGRKGAVAICGPYYAIEKSLLNSVSFAFLNLSSILHMFGIIVTRGTNTAVKKSAYYTVGGYSDIPILDDIELGYKLKRIGKIICTKKMAVWTSARRFKKNGFIRTNLSWLKGDIMIMTRFRFKEEYARQEY